MLPFGSDDALRQRISAAHARAQARKFVHELVAQRWALPVPESWDSMTDEQIKIALDFLARDPRIQRRPDWKWEAI